MNFQTMSQQRKFILIAAGIGVISMFLPWISISVFGYSTSVNGFHEVGILIFLCFVAAIVVSLMGNQTANLDKTYWMAAIIAGGLAALLMVIQFLRMMDAISYIGFGFWIALVASLALVYVVYKYRSPTDTLKGGFDSLKGDLENKMKTPPSNTTTTSTTTTTTDVNRNTTDTTPPL